MIDVQREPCCQLFNRQWPGSLRSQRRHIGRTECTVASRRDNPRGDAVIIQESGDARIEGELPSNRRGAPLTANRSQQAVGIAVA
jgi:hypothetical protein